MRGADGRVSAMARFRRSWNSRAECLPWYLSSWYARSFGDCRVYQCPTAFLPKRADNFPWRLLDIRPQPCEPAGRFESKRQPSVQLINRRVSSEPCRIDPTSCDGVKHETSSISEWSAAFVIDDRRFQTIRLAATWPRGIRR